MLPASEPEAPAAAPRASVGARIAERLPEIFIQALFLLIAVVLAFAVEEWREERELDRLAEEAREAILQELQHNRDELLESREDTLAMIASLEGLLAAPEGLESPALREFAANFELALLSGAAWRSAQSMDVARRMDYAWMLQVARAHELQSLYEQAQWAAVEANTRFKSASDPAARASGARALLARMRLLAGFSQALEGDYSDIL